MAIPAKSRWWIATLVIVGVLLLISALALDRPNVVWDAGNPECPFCRHQVEMYGTRCAACRGDFDWVTAPESASPISHASLSVLEAERLQEAVRVLGPDVAAQRVAAATELSVEAARAYLGSVGRGECGWCGGTRKDLAAPELESAEACPLCLGTGSSIGCGGDRRARLGDWSAELAAQRYEAKMADLLCSHLDAEAFRREARELAEGFLTNHAGTVQAGRIYFWPRVGWTAEGRPPRESDLAVHVARDRIDAVLGALEAAK
jgi:hypothetical protein